MLKSLDVVFCRKYWVQSLKTRIQRQLLRANACSTQAQAENLLLETMMIGAWRTIRTHLYVFVRLEYFIQRHGHRNETVFPCKASTVVKYLLHLRDLGIKPSVPASVKASVGPS